MKISYPHRVTGYGLRVTVFLFELSPLTSHFSPDFTGGKIS